MNIQVELAQTVVASIPEEAEVDYLHLLDELAVCGFALTDSELAQDTEVLATRVAEELRGDLHQISDAEFNDALNESTVGIVRDQEGLASAAYFEVLQQAVND